MSELVAIANGAMVGQLRQGRDGRLTFTYDPTWRRSEGAFPLSLSIPLAAPDYPDDVIRPFLAGLLPDNDRVLEQWGRRFGVSARNPFALLTYVGEDCAGAVQFVQPDRVPAVQSTRRREIHWLTNADVAARLRALRTDIAAWQPPRSQGQFSLAGAQPKIALFFEHGRWGVPKGRTPTTHILKPPTGEFDGFAENEHVCLRLAQAIGLPAASSQVIHFEDQPAIVVTRYDRVATRRGVVRIHQEDFCQALGVPPTRKYQSEGGPGIEDIVRIVRSYSSDVAADLDTFLRSLALHWVIAAPDAHAKNYSLLLGAQTTARLAPLYDIVTALPYPAFDHRRLTLAMRIGGVYRIHRIGPYQWRKLATHIDTDVDALLASVRDVATHVADVGDQVRRDVEQEGIQHPIIGRIVTSITERARQCTAMLAPTTRRP